MQTDSKQNISGDDESIWQKIVDKAVEFGGDLSAKVGELSDTVKQWAKNLAERISGSKDEDSKSETKQTESSPQTTDINANTKNIQTEQATPTPAGANTLASDIQDSGSSNLPEKYVLFKDFNFSADPSDKQEYYSSQFTNMVLLDLAKKNAFAIDGSNACNFEAVNQQYNEFFDFYEKYMGIQESCSGNASALTAAMSSLDNMENGTEYRHLIEDTMQEQADYANRMETLKDRGVSDFSSVYAEYPEAAFASGDIDYDTYTDLTSDQMAFGTDLVQRTDKNRTNISFDDLSDQTDPNQILSERITNLATLRYAESMLKEGAVDASALQEKIDAFSEYASSVASGQSVTADPEITDMYQSCASDMQTLTDAIQSKNQECEKIKDSSSQAAVMKYFYEGYEDPDVTYAYGAIDQDTYESKLTSNLIEMPSDEFNAYVASARSDQIDPISSDACAENTEQFEG